MTCSYKSMTLLGVALLCACSDEVAGPEQLAEQPEVAVHAAIPPVDVNALAAMVEDAIQRVVPALAGRLEADPVAAGLSALARALEGGEAPGVRAAAYDLRRALDAYRPEADELADLTLLRILLDAAVPPLGGEHRH